MERIFTELTPEVDYTAQYYSLGKEKKEIASVKFRALATINNQLMLAYEILGVRNRSELTLLYAKRIALKKVRAFVVKNKEAIKATTACILLSAFSLNLHYEISTYERRIEIVESLRVRSSRRVREFN